MAEVRFTRFEAQPPAMKRVLIVDDNDRYAEAISADVQSRGAEVTRAVNAAEGIRLLKKDGARFDALITDITMESQVSGLIVMLKARKTAFRGIVVVATTGLDTPVSFFFNRFFLGSLFRSDYLIPKRPIKRDKRVIWIKARR